MTTPTNNDSISRGGIVTLVVMVTLPLVTLRVGQIVAWPWLWVLSPLWMSALAAGAYLVVRAVKR